MIKYECSCLCDGFHIYFFLNLLHSADDCSLMTMISWMLWKNRNDIVWRGKRNSACFLVNLASRMLYEWTAVQREIDLVSNLQGHHGYVIWSSPPPGKVKINIVAALFPL